MIAEFPLLVSLNFKKLTRTPCHPPHEALVGFHAVLVEQAGAWIFAGAEVGYVGVIIIYLYE